LPCNHTSRRADVLRSISVNLYVTDLWHGSACVFVAGDCRRNFLRALRLIRMPDKCASEIFTTSTRAASSIGGLLLWYELQTQPTSIAVAWGAFGLVLFEYGLLRKITQFRYQAYVALIAAFTRIFFSNLTASEPGEFWVADVHDPPARSDFLFHLRAIAAEGRRHPAATADCTSTLSAYLGTATIVALFYFSFRSNGRHLLAAVVFALLGASLLLDRPVFLDQGLLLTVGILARGMAHNLFGAGYFGGGDWQGRYFVLSSAAAILLASLYFAFRLRGATASLRARTPGPKHLR